MTVTKSMLRGCFGALAGLAMLSLTGQAASAQTYGLATMQPGTLAHTVASAIDKLDTRAEPTTEEIVASAEQMGDDELAATLAEARRLRSRNRA